MVMVGHSKRLAEPLTRRQRRGLVAALAVLALAVVVATVIAVTDSRGNYGASANGCINLTVPSTLGGALIHSCGAQARALCAHSETANDSFSRSLRPECVLAGLAPKPAAAG